MASSFCSNSKEIAALFMCTANMYQQCLMKPLASVNASLCYSTSSVPSNLDVCPDTDKCFPGVWNFGNLS